MTSPTPHSISPTDAPSRLLFHRPDLVARRKQRKMAAELSEWAGHSRAVVDVLAGCLAALPNCSVKELVERLAEDVEAAARYASPTRRDHIASPAYRIETAFNLGWSLLDEGPQRDLLRVLALAGGGPLPRSLLREAANAESASVDHALLAGFCRIDADDNLITEQTLIEYLLDHCLDNEDLGRLRGPLLGAFHAALLEPADDHEDYLEPAWQGCWDLCSEPAEAALRASLLHRWVLRLRRRGEFKQALDLIAEEHSARKLRDRGHDTDEPAQSGLAAYQGLLHLDEAVLHIESGAIQRGLEVLRALIAASNARTDAARDAGPDTSDLLARAELVKTQAEAFYLRDPAALASLPERLRRSAHEAHLRPLCLGLAHLRNGAFPEARLSLAKARELNLPDQQEGTAWIELSIVLAQAHALRDEAEDAREHLEAARVASGGDLDRKQLASLPLALHELGLLAADQGDFKAAGTYLDEAAMLAASSLPSGHPTRLLITYHRGLVHLSRGDLRQAEAQFDRVLEQADRSLRVQHHVVLLARCGKILCWYRGSEKGSRARTAEELREIRTELGAWPGEEELRAEIAALSRLSSDTNP